MHGFTHSVDDIKILLREVFLLNPCLISLLRLQLHGEAFFVEKSVVLHHLEGPELTTERIEKRKKPSTRREVEETFVYVA